MTTKSPSAVQEFSPDTLEKIAYESVSDIPTEEPNDRNRLAFHIWRWLATKKGTLEESVAESGARLLVQRQEALKTIREALAKHNIASG